MKTHRELTVTPVLLCKPPKYPTKEDLLRDPSLLRARPERWRAKPALCAILTFTVATGLCACAPNAPAPSPVSTLAPSPSPSPSPSPVQSAALQIPVFEHGMGRGSYGCASVAPPVFLSEEEAAQVIREEALLQGVDFSGSKTIEGTFPAPNLYGDETMKDESWKGELALDGYDESLGIGFEFVSQRDVVDWQQTGDMMCTVETYDMKDAAQRLSQSTPGLAAFYDPAQDWAQFDFDWENQEQDIEAYIQEYSAAQKERMLEDLRAQVRDFLAWLSAQGVI